MPLPHLEIVNVVVPVSSPMVGGKLMSLSCPPFGQTTVIFSPLSHRELIRKQSGIGQATAPSVMTAHYMRPAPPEVLKTPRK